MKKDNRIVVDLNKVQWARFYYENQYGDKVSISPIQDTYRGTTINENTLCIGQIINIPSFTIYSYPVKSISYDFEWVNAKEYLKKGNLLDEWTPKLYLKLTANESLIYTGEKAKSIWKAWQEKIFKKGNK